MSMLMLFSSLIPLMLALFMLFSNFFLSIELNLTFLYSFSFPVSFLLDWTSLMFLFTVMLISSMILFFSVDYIPPLEHKPFSLLLLSFVLAMSFLIMSDNIMFILLGWDGLGLTSFILVIYYQNASSASSGAITIFSNRLGDIFILLSIAFLSSSCNWNFSMNENFEMMIVLFLVIAACTKSAQFPFSAWLPAAMAAPTPISALVHSSTLVTAGVFLLIRVMNYPHPFCMTFLLIISSMTAIYASMSANWEMDMKKIIALSTLSQIAMMMFALALGSPLLAFFHLITHALFKSMMFLCAGSVIHSSSYQDMRMMGTLSFKSPIVATVLGIASLSLMAIPFMSGFFSKDPIIETILHSKTLMFTSILMVLSVGMTSAYSIRMISFSWKFTLKFKPDVNIHPSNFMEIPMMLMAPFSILMGTLMMWISSPEQLIIIPNYYKLLILTSLLLGILVGTSLKNSSKLYKLLGQAAISLWFNHFISTMPNKSFSKLMMSFLKNDNSWQEVYGPLYLFSSSSKMSIFPDLSSSQFMYIIMMLSLYPIIMFSY